MIKKNKTTGFTLIELLIYIVFISIFMSGAILFATDILYSKAKSNVKQTLTHNLNTASERIALEIREASSVNSVTSTSISLANTTASRNPTVIDISSGRLRIGYGASGSCPTSSPCFLTADDVNVSSLTFTNLNGLGGANINWVMTMTTSGERVEYDESETIRGSAELRSNE